MPAVTEKTTVSTPAELDALPDLTVIVSSGTFPDGKPAVMAAEKIDGDWFAIGHPIPFGSEDFSEEALPAEVVWRPSE